MAAFRRRRFFAATRTSRQVFVGSQVTIGMAEPQLGPRPPTVISGQLPFRPILVHLAPSPTQARKPYSIPPFPIVVYAPPLAPPVAVHLTRNKIPSRMAHLGAPVVVTTPTPPIFFGPTVHRAYSLRGRPKSKLNRPAVVTPAAVQTFTGPRTHLAYSSRGRTITQLRTPMVVLAAVVQTFAGPETHLARITPPRVHSRLAPPTDTVGLEDQGRVKVWLAYSLRGKAKPRLNPPTVVAPVLAPPILVSLAPSSRGKAKPKLSRPAVVAFFAALPTAISLAYSLRGRPKSILRRPIVVAPVLARPVEVELAYSRRGRPKSRLQPPTVVFPFLARPLDITLARIRPPHTIAELRPPTDTTGLEDQGQVRVHLAPSFRGRPLNHLFPPTVVAPVLAAPVAVTLAASFRGTPKSKLSAPTVVAPVLTLHEAIVRLARITPPPVHSILRKPVVIDLRPQVRYLATSLAYSRRGAPKSKLSAPSAFASRPQADTTLLVHLAYSLRGRPIYRLGEPSLNLCEIDTFQRTRALGNGWGTADTGQAWTHPDGGNAKFGVNGTQGQMACDVAAAIRSARLPFPTADTDTVVSFVLPTTPVGGNQSMYALGRFADAANRYGVRFTQNTNGSFALALSKRVAGVTNDSLAVKNYVAGSFTPGNVYWLHFRVVGQTLYGKIWADGVAEPTTWDVSIQDTDLTGTGVGVLGFPFAGNTTLPTVLWDNFSACPVTNAQFEGPRTTLVRIRPPRTLARLRPPVAVRIFIARPIDTTLAPSRFPRPKSKLRPPTRTFAFVARPLSINLAPSSRGVPSSQLAPPAVTNPFVVRPIQRTLARITPPPVRSRLHPPTVIGGAITFPGPKVTLVRIRPPATRWFYIRLNVEANPVCYGDVSGFDFAPVVCGDDDSPLVSGFTQGAEVCGDDTGDLATGASAPGGSVTGGDEKREGC